MAEMPRMPSATRDDPPSMPRLRNHRPLEHVHSHLPGMDAQTLGVGFTIGVNDVPVHAPTVRDLVAVRSCPRAHGGEINAGGRHVLDFRA